MEVARALLGRPVQVVTNSIPIANLMSASKQSDVILIGGYVSPRTGVAMGPLAVEMMRGIRVRKSILGAGGIVAEGVYNSNVLLVETERQMMACGQEVVIVADHTKFGRLSLSKLCDLDDVDAIVADPAVPDEYRAAPRRGGRDPAPRPAGRSKPPPGRPIATQRSRQDRIMSSLATAARPRLDRAAWSGRSSSRSRRRTARPRRPSRPTGRTSS